MRASFLVLLFPFLMITAVLAATDPFASLTPSDKALLKLQIERWIHDQVKHDWADLWEMQEQTPELKNELLLGNKDAPDMDRKQYEKAMRDTIGTGYPEIKAFTLTEVDKESDGFQVVGCARLQREEWKANTIQYIHLKIVDGKVRFGWPDGSGEACKP
jgi:hypothetical protein